MREKRLPGAFDLALLTPSSPIGSQPSIVDARWTGKRSVPSVGASTPSGAAARRKPRLVLRFADVHDRVVEHSFPETRCGDDSLLWIVNHELTVIAKRQVTSQQFVSHEAEIGVQLTHELTRVDAVPLPA